MEKMQMVTLANLGKGAAIERFDDELARVLENVLDPNTGIGTREITLKFKIKPNDNRDFCSVDVECSSKLSAPATFRTQIFVGRDANGFVATEYNPQQMRLGIDPAEKISAALQKEGGKEN